MTEMHRRAMLGAMLNGAAVAVAGLVLTQGEALSAPLMSGMGQPATEEGLIQKAVVVVHRHHPVRRRRRRVCWWRRGRRVCAWR